MANGKLEALLAEWRQKRLLIFSNRLQPTTAGSPVTGCDRTDREKLDQEVLDLEEQGLELRLGGIWRIWRRMWCFAPRGCIRQIRPWRRCAAGGGGDLGDGDIFQVCPCPVIAVTGSDVEDHHHDSPG